MLTWISKYNFRFGLVYLIVFEEAAAIPIGLVQFWSKLKFF